jgi:integrase
MLETEKKEGVWWVTHPDRHGEIHTYPTGFTDDEEFANWRKESKIGELAKLADANGVSAETVSRILGSDKRMCELFLDWKSWLFNNSEETTVKLYSDAVTSWGAYCCKFSKFPSEVKEKDIYEFINGDSDRKASTRKVYLAAIRSFFKWMHAKGFVLSDPSKLVKVSYRKMSQEQKEPKKAIAFNREQVDSINRHIDKELSNNLEVLKRGDYRESRSPAMYRVTLHRIENLRFWKVAVNLSWETALRLSDLVGS